EVRTTQVSTTQVSTAQVSRTEVRSSEVGIAQIRTNARMLSSPMVPFINAACKSLNLFLLCHGGATPLVWTSLARSNQAKIRLVRDVVMLCGLQVKVGPAID